MPAKNATNSGMSSQVPGELFGDPPCCRAKTTVCTRSWTNSPSSSSRFDEPRSHLGTPAITRTKLTVLTQDLHLNLASAGTLQGQEDGAFADSDEAGLESMSTVQTALRQNSQAQLASTRATRYIGS
jgi:hypothetical protein